MARQLKMSREQTRFRLPVEVDKTLTEKANKIGVSKHELAKQIVIDSLV
jgi:hypothetical protein